MRDGATTAHDRFHMVDACRATVILHDAAQAIVDRASSRDCATGERSMARCVAAFNALYGLGLTEEQGWQFMSLLKKARASAGRMHLDDYIDDSAYAALAGECAARAANQDVEHG